MGWAGRESRPAGGARAVVGMFLWVGAVLAAGGGLETAHGQAVGRPTQPDFTGAVDLVEVAVSVRDGNGLTVDDLSGDDIEVYEDGVRQSVAAFRRVDIARERFEVAVSYPSGDVTTNGDPGRPGRVYLLLLDDLHTHPLRSAEVKGIAREFIENGLLLHDLAAVAMTSGLGSSQHFTGDRRLLLEAVDQFVGRYVYPARRPRWWPGGDARERSGGGLPGLERMGGERELKARNAREMLAAIERFAEWLGSVDARRKAMVVIGQGIDYDTSDLFGDREALGLLGETARVADAAARNNVTIYAIDPRGLPTAEESSIRTRFLVDESPEATWRAKQSLRALAEETGGFAFINSNQFSQAFERIVEEQSTYYLLGYVAPRDVPDGRLHHIRIRVGRPDVIVAARRSYVHGRRRGSRGDVATEMVRLLDSPLPQRGLRLEVTSLRMRGDGGGRHPLVLGVWLEPSAAGGGDPGDVILGIVAADRDGRVLERRMVEVSVPAEMRPTLAERGLRLLARMDLSTLERTHVRVGVMDARTGAVGSVHHEAGGLDGGAAGMGISGIALNADGEAPVPTVVGDAGVMAAVPFPVGIRRVFDPAEDLLLFAEVYSGRGVSEEEVFEVSCVIRSEGGAVVYEASEFSDAREGRASYRGTVPLGNLEPGRYLLEVGASVVGGDGARARREVPFRIRPRG